MLYAHTGSGGGTKSNRGAIDMSGSGVDNSHNNNINTNYGGSSGSSGSNGTGLTASEIKALAENLTVNPPEDDQIFNELTGKAECVYDKLDSSGTKFADAIKKFDGEFPVSHLKFEGSTSLPNNVNAKTLPPSNYLITIQINTNNLKRPNLSIARTIIHEVIHAEMFRKILSILDNGGDLDGLTTSEWNKKLSNGDYPGIFDYYSRFGVNGMQHEQMATHYIDKISDLLEEFQPNLSQDTYNALSWEGLINTTAWNSLSQSEKNAIKNIINNYNSGGAESCNVK